MPVEKALHEEQADHGKSWNIKNTCKSEKKSIK